ncbi:hypothetical protein AURDEDRAFT_188048 [Auricularia subglabra TFB-10046 SS5]|uniref:Uncharacterized protein n=1 Tax=Auricularia subglabra (strain TFB-10046 / SS5) TaxID=717982 RepID=J0LHG7_AURST|nr:hypothetical protein AURDEDRAFT_188048 [Auricularia subglabra TFB-10046 SS5]
MVGGHALWDPRQSNETRGGTIGDIGFVEGGIFCKIGNAYTDPPKGLQPLAPPAPGELDMTTIYNASAFIASQKNTISLQLLGTTPAAASPESQVSFTAGYTSQDTECAFLACLGLHREKSIVLGNSQKALKRYLYTNYATLYRNAGNQAVFIVQSSLKASGWIAGVAFGSARVTAAGATLNVPGVGNVGASFSQQSTSGNVAFDVANCQKSVGPIDWSAGRDFMDYTVVVGPAVARRRDIIRAKLALGVTASDSALSAAHRPEQQASSIVDSGGATGNTIGSGDNSGGEIQFGHTGQTPAVADMTVIRAEESSCSEDSEDSNDAPRLPTPLDCILDEFLAQHETFDAVLGDSELLYVYYQTHDQHPCAKDLLYTWDEEQLTNSQGITTLVAFLTALHPRTQGVQTG